MKMRHIASILAAIGVVILAGCDEGIDDWNSSAKITGYVYTDPSHTTGLNGVQVILEADPNADVPYEGPDRWTATNDDGYFEGAVFLGRNQLSDSAGYNYIGDMSVAYFYGNKTFRWIGGITVAPGSNFILPPVDTTMFQTMSGGE